MSESENIPMPLYSLPLSSCNLFLLLRRMPFFLSLILATPFAPLHLALVSALLLYPDFIPRSVLTSKSLLEVVQPSFPLPISIMLSTLSHFARQRIQVTKTLSNVVNQPLHPNTIRHHLKKSGMKAVVKSKCPLLSAKHRIRWAQMGVEKAR